MDPSFTDLTYTVREVRFQAIHVDDSTPSLAGITVFLCAEDGQWSQLVSWDCGPFDTDEQREAILAQCHRLMLQVLS